MLTLLLVVAVGDGFEDVARPFLASHCVRCHGETEARAGLDLSKATETSPMDDFESWDWLRERVEFGEMPPAGEAQPTGPERAAFLEWLGGALAHRTSDPLPLVGVPLRRLTRVEYERAARALLGVEIDATRFLPEDAVGHGFDHVAAAQTLSEGDFVRYLDAAEALAERAFPADEPGPPTIRRYSPAEMVGGRASRDARWLSTRGAAGGMASLPRAGSYLVRAETFGQQAGPDPCRVRLVLGGSAESEIFDVAATPGEEPVVVEARLRVERGGDFLAGVRFLNDYYVASEGDRPAQDRNLALRRVEVIGPLEAAEPTGRSAALEDRIGRAKEPRAELRAVVRELAAAAWRSPAVGDDDVDALLALSSADEPVSGRLRTAAVGVFASPRFVFKSERGLLETPDDRGSVRLAGHEVATRLAGFLWSSVPDLELLERAAAGRLVEPEDVRAAAAAMLEDPRATALAVDFGEQWLQLRPLGSKRADREAFPGFSRELVASMLEETRRVLVDSLREERSLWELVNGESTFVDRRLMRHYGLTADVVVEEFDDGWSRVSLATTARRGLLGHGSVLFATSEPTRTSPVRRGKWVLEVLLGSAPPAPPPGADNLPEVEAGEESLSLRERLDRHRSDPNCAACHARMDPLGFGLEAFDGIGALRAAEDPARRDERGVLPDGRAFEGPVELTGVLRGEGRFLDAFVERLLVYALGRGLTRADRGSLAQVRGALDGESPTMHSAVLEIVTTPEFLRLPRLPQGDPSDDSR